MHKILDSQPSLVHRTHRRRAIPFADVHMTTHCGHASHEQHFHSHGGPVDRVIVSDAPGLGSSNPRVDSASKISRRIRNEVRSQRLVDMGVRFGHGRQQKPSIEIVGGDVGIAVQSVGSVGWLDGADLPIDHLDVDEPAVGQ